jgi:simple sugar transport system substrate-binding protein
LTWVAKRLLEGGTITDGMEVPGVGKVSLDGDVIKVDAMADITPQNVDSFGF